MPFVHTSVLASGASDVLSSGVHWLSVFDVNKRQVHTESGVSMALQILEASARNAGFQGLVCRNRKSTSKTFRSKGIVKPSTPAAINSSPDGQDATEWLDNG